MNILTLDTATELLSVSLSTASGEFFEHAHYAGLHHTERLMPTVRAVLSEGDIRASDLGLVVCAKGPGSFTGLRIGMSTAKGLRDALGVPIVSIPTLDALAYPFSWFEGVVLPTIDARKRRVYGAIYRGLTCESGYLDVPVTSLVERSGKRRSLVTGVDESLISRIASMIPGATYALQRGTGASYAALGRIVLDSRGPDSIDSGPFYLRSSDAERARSAGVGEQTP